MNHQALTVGVTQLCQVAAIELRNLPIENLQSRFLTRARLERHIGVIIEHSVQHLINYKVTTTIDAFGELESCLIVLEPSANHKIQMLINLKP